MDVKRLFARFNSLRWRLTLFYSGLLFALLVGVGIFTYLRLDNYLYQNVQQRLDDARLPPFPVRDFIPPGEVTIDNYAELIQQYSNGLAFRPPQGVYVIVVNGEGKIVPPDLFITSDRPLTLPFQPISGEQLRLQPEISLQPPALNVLQQLRPGQVQSYTAEISRLDTNGAVTGTERALVNLQVPAGNTNYLYNASGQPQIFTLRIASLVQLDNTLSQIRLLLIIGVLGAVLLALALGLPLAKLSLQPLSSIARIARQTGSSDLSKRVTVPGRYDKSAAGDEVWQLAQEFNTMLDKLEAAFKSRQASEIRTRQFVANASHELRSPLTILGGYLDVLMMGAKDDPAKAERIVSSMRGEVTRLSRLVVDLLTLTRLDANGGSSLKIEMVFLPDLLNRAVDNFSVLAGARQLELQLEVSTETVSVPGDPDQLYQVIANLLDNAIRYTPLTGSIKVGLALSLVLADPARQQAVISVRDNGYGIPAEHLAHIFDRFYRADSSRARTTGNSGLGLAISQSIIEAHGGTIRVDSTPEAGTEFTITLNINSLASPTLSTNYQPAKSWKE